MSRPLKPSATCASLLPTCPSTWTQSYSPTDPSLCPTHLSSPTISPLPFHTDALSPYDSIFEVPPSFQGSLLLPDPQSASTSAFSVLPSHLVWTPLNALVGMSTSTAPHSPHWFIGPASQPWPSVIYWFNKHLSSTYSVPATAVGTEDRAGSETNPISSCFPWLDILVKIMNK